MKRFKPYPILCNYYITTRCNARCIFCDIYQKKGMDANTLDVLDNLKDLKHIGVKFIDFTGGEPLLHPDLPLMLIEAKKLGFITTVTTNCILYPKRFREIAGLVDLLHFSLDSPIPEEHDSIRNVSCFDIVLESIDIAKNLRERPDILFTVTDNNVIHIREMTWLAQKSRLIILINPVFSYYGNEPVNQDTLNVIMEMASYPYVYVNRGIIRLMKEGGNHINNPRCRAVTTTVVVSPDNHLLLPCFHKADRRIPIKRNLLEIQKSKVLKYFKRKEGKFSFCEGCTVSCYFDPSFTYGVDDYFLLSQLSKIKYIKDKYLRSPIEYFLNNYDGFRTRNKRYN